MAVSDLSTGPELRDLQAQAGDLFMRKRLVSFGAPALVLLYFVYAFFAFDIPGLAERARMDNAAILVADSYSYKTHVTRDYRNGGITAAIEGEAKGRYPAGAWPDYVTILGDEAAVLDLADGHRIDFDGMRTDFEIPGYGTVTTVLEGREIRLDLPEGPTPDWINASRARVTVTTDAARLTVTRARAEVFVYSFGWEQFWFTLSSPFHDKSLSELVALAFSSERVTPERSNAAAIFHDFWNNEMWRHRDVLWAIFETILMAFLGTMGAALVALPLAFLAAKNFTPLGALRFAARRLFDFVRGVDGLIWTIILSRAFGPGPLTGSLAILITDTGSFGKMFSEALENVDSKQIEGVASTGAKPLQRYRFGVIPQVMPVFLSQILYYLESNTRSATVIGAITGGGIGLLITQAITTQKDWEEVSYYIVLIVLMVIAMDWFSGWLRRRLITGG